MYLNQIGAIWRGISGYTPFEEPDCLIFALGEPNTQREDGSYPLWYWHRSGGEDVMHDVMTGLGLVYAHFDADNSRHCWTLPR